MGPEVKSMSTAHSAVCENLGVFEMLAILNQHAESRVKSLDSTRKRDIASILTYLAGEINLGVQTFNRSRLSKAELEEHLPRLKSTHARLAELLALIEQRPWFWLLNVLCGNAVDQYRDSVDRLDSLIETWEISVDGSIYEILRERLEEVKA